MWTLDPDEVAHYEPCLNLVCDFSVILIFAHFKGNRWTTNIFLPLFWRWLTCDFMQFCRYRGVNL